MKKIQAINELYSSIYEALKANSDLRKYVTNIYEYLPKQVTIPYLRLRVVNYNNLHMLSNFATKARFSCDIYTYHIDSMFAIIRHINLILKSIEGFSSEVILESIAFLIIVRTGHRKAESTARRKDSNRGMFFLALFFIANQ
ncbi:DUF3168 domain-containing protein [Wolbachia endosymbiont (group A) of Sphecodes monilicornis]|uniref:DUF3168 domain-containing protein n=1 Tax=Wolbachia endosymbiont (group A) of Sphecodes monilicornis TaxID=2954060 RepID=UPI0022273C37|nr:DUF3168 domain-containing protein [Wolbachia endosymbiont (group A) of Sphecodes monilicornis]